MLKQRTEDTASRDLGMEEARWSKQGTERWRTQIPRSERLVGKDTMTRPQAGEAGPGLGTTEKQETGGANLGERKLVKCK